MFSQERTSGGEEVPWDIQAPPGETHREVQRCGEAHQEERKHVSQARDATGQKVQLTDDYHHYCSLEFAPRLWDFVSLQYCSGHLFLSLFYP